MEAVLHAAHGHADTFVSQNRFRGKRLAVANLLEPCAIYSNVDYYKVARAEGSFARGGAREGPEAAEERRHTRVVARPVFGSGASGGLGAQADEERDSLSRALREAAGRGEELRRLRNERAIMADHFRAMRDMGLRHLPPEERRTAYDALSLRAYVDEEGDVRITGIFDADLTELLPASWAVAKATAQEYDPNLNVQLPTPHRGVVSVRHPHLGT